MSCSGYPGPAADPVVVRRWYEEFVERHGIFFFLSRIAPDDNPYRHGLAFRSMLKSDHPEWKDKIELWEVLHGQVISKKQGVI